MSQKNLARNLKSFGPRKILHRSRVLSRHEASHIRRYEPFTSVRLGHVRKPKTFTRTKVKLRMRASRVPILFYDEIIDQLMHVQTLAPSRIFHGEEKNEFIRIDRLSLPSFNLPIWSEEKQKLVELVAELTDCFFDTVKRQIIFFDLKGAVESLRAEVGLESRVFLRVLNMCCDALNNTKAEKLEKKQVDTLKFVIKNMDENMDDCLATELEGILVESGLNPMPTVDGVASLYE